MTQPRHVPLKEQPDWITIVTLGLQVEAEHQAKLDQYPRGAPERLQLGTAKAKVAREWGIAEAVYVRACYVARAISADPDRFASVVDLLTTRGPTVALRELRYLRQQAGEPTHSRPVKNPNHPRHTTLLRHQLNSNQRLVCPDTLVGKALETLDGLAMSLDQVVIADTDPTFHAAWAETLRVALRTFNRIRKELHHEQGTNPHHP